ncbi:tetratricopeptide repeat protein [Aphanothece sacrum]|uniref:Uncharacterized protein n=1 Tax=Aphanothece sacrum FPU1 TaxID=1920663 RepID=A0A401IC02_APHSA|nr:tetratricopeptide repeat protein [Aphanothece sacrum]GBF78808.1 hypothetical protein AsFPU1_0198 [Aphanothece sacrum FPU1]GBF83040.1 hypothetical protein AsFPU3_0078 [Aphanothece sacrum FPU3]
MSDSNLLSNRYNQLIDSIIDLTLQGKIRSKEQVYRMLVQDIVKGTGEVFERLLFDRMEVTKAQLETKVKATRVLRGLQTIQGEWERWQQENQVDQAITTVAEQIKQADPNHYLIPFLGAIDNNNPQGLSKDQLFKLAQSLKANSQSLVETELGDGILDGLKSFSTLEPDLISWIYEQNQGALGFGAEKSGPWIFWAKNVSSPLIKQLFNSLAQNESVINFVQVSYQGELRAWVELILVLKYLQQGLVIWFDQQPYNAKFGQKNSYSTFLSFANIWSQLSQGFQGLKNELRESCFLMMLQIFRQFTRREDFPFYSGIFASFSGNYLQETLQYFDAPLLQVERTQEKARILTLLGYSQRTLGNYKQAQNFHEEALDIAREASDFPCEIANLNHLSRIFVQQKNHDDAINYSQRALILSRQVGNRLGEANALVNLGYGEIFRAKQIDVMEAEIYEQAISYLQQGLKISERLDEHQSQALAYNSLGIAYLVLSQPATAITTLEKGTQMALISGDIYLQGINFAYLAEAYHNLGNLSQAIGNACLGMYLLARINSGEWRQSAGLLTIIKGQISQNNFDNILEQNRSQIVKIIGVDGYNYLGQLLDKYQ